MQSLHIFNLLQVADFNLSRRIQEHAGQMTHSGSINSPQWSAPERLAGDDYSFPADVFSFGVILWELCTLSASLRRSHPNFADNRFFSICEHASAHAQQMCRLSGSPRGAVQLGLLSSARSTSGVRRACRGAMARRR